MRLHASAVALACALVLSGCTVSGTAGPDSQSAAIPDNGPASVAGADEPTLDGAKALAQAEIDRYAAGDAGGAWDLLDAASQAKVNRADYIAVHEACPLRAPAYTLKSARLETPTQAVITVGFLGLSQAYKTNYQNGHWRWQMAPSDADEYRVGATAKIAALKKLGLCSTGN
jgi:hypothetical protein